MGGGGRIRLWHACLLCQTPSVAVHGAKEHLAVVHIVHSVCPHVYRPVKGYGNLRRACSRAGRWEIHTAVE